jgi:hypothetical protein
MTEEQLTRVAAAAQELQGDHDPIDAALTLLNAQVTPRARTLQPGRVSAWWQRIEENNR